MVLEMGHQGIVCSISSYKDGYNSFDQLWTLNYKQIIELAKIKVFLKLVLIQKLYFLYYFNLIQENYYIIWKRLMAKGKKNKKNSSVDVQKKSNKEETQDKEEQEASIDNDKQLQNKKEQTYLPSGQLKLSAYNQILNVNSSNTVMNTLQKQKTPENFQSNLFSQQKIQQKNTKIEQFEAIVSQVAGTVSQQQQSTDKQKITSSKPKIFRKEIQKQISKFNEQIKAKHQINPQNQNQTLKYTVQHKQQRKTKQDASLKNDFQMGHKELLVHKKIEDTDLPYRQELLDGLNQIQQFGNDYVYQNPLTHQQQAHASSQFIQNFQPAVYHLSERLLQQELHSTPSMRQNIGSRGSLQPLQQSKQFNQISGHGYLDIHSSHQDKPLSILKSYYSESDPQQKNENKPYLHRQSIQKYLRKQSQSGRSNTSSRKSRSILHAPQNPTYINPIPTVPTVPTNQDIQPPSSHILSTQIIEKPKSQLDFQAINRQALRQREQQWKKLQQKELEPLNFNFNILIPQNVQIPHVQPNVPQKLSYTNNLPIITHQRIEQQKQRLNNVNQTNKQKTNDFQKGNKNKNNSFKRLGVSMFVAGLCLGACLLGKLDKKVASWSSIACFMATYLVQK